MSDVDEILTEFLVECHENLDQLDQELVELESNAGDLDRIAAIFRMVHTIKGTSGFFGFGSLESLTHAGENLLSRLRDGELELDADRTSVLLHLVDAVRAILGSIEATGEEGAADFSELIGRIEALQGPTEAAAPSASSPQEGLVLFSTPAPPAAPPPEPPPAPKPASGPSISDTTIRVNVDLLDDLMNLVGELVLARNQILQHTASGDDACFARSTQRLNLITSELQEGVMKTRMQPIAHVFNKFPRVVRDLALSCEKTVDLRMEGKETELDRTIIEAIKDPLTHIIRNAVDHGIESPAQRLAAGKPEGGRITMRAYHEGGQVNIEIEDDGKGLDPARVRDKAVEKGLLGRERANAMTDEEAASLIFAPGFSTATTVTNLSGRGVGMDVVKTNIERIGGMVDLHNEPGRGLTLKLKIPLTLAIVPALIVFCAGERFAIPQVSLLELVRVERERVADVIQRIRGTAVYRLRDNLLPLVDLREQLGLAPSPDDDAVNIIVLQADKQSFGLVVDGVHDTEEIVVKPLGRTLKSIPAYAGTTIMGDGRVALILDVHGLARMADALHHGQAAAAEEEKDESAAEARETLLLCASGEHARLAIPLAQVSRLEEIEPASIERSAGQDVVQYRGGIMPLVNLAQALGGDGATGDAGPLQVLGHAAGDQSIGLVVDHILDIVDEAVDLQRVSSQSGMLGSAVVGGRITDFVDVDGILRRVDPSWATAAP